MSPQAPGICHCQEGSDPAIPASGSEDGDRHVATLLAMTFSARAGRPPAGLQLISGRLACLPHSSRCNDAHRYRRKPYSPVMLAGRFPMNRVVIGPTVGNGVIGIRQTQRDVL
jgi:hypothetical protein